VRRRLVKVTILPPPLRTSWEPARRNSAAQWRLLDYACSYKGNKKSIFAEILCLTHLAASCNEPSH
jgi:hypothetical protein